MIVKVLDCQERKFSDGNVMYELTLNSPVGLAFVYSSTPRAKGDEGKVEIEVDFKHRFRTRVIF